MFTISDVTYSDPIGSMLISCQDIIVQGEIMGSLRTMSMGVLNPVLETWLIVVKISQLDDNIAYSESEDAGLYIAQFESLEDFLGYINSSLFSAEKK